MAQGAVRRGLVHVLCRLGAGTGIVRASDNAIWQIDDYQTHNLYVQYTLGDDTDTPMRIRIGARNIFDETPPLADTNYGYLGDLHNPAGRFLYASVRKQF